MPGFRRIPDFIRERIAEASSDVFYVGATRSVSLSDIDAGRWSGLGLTASGGQIDHAPEVLPPASAGRWSRWNLEGRWIVRTDLPKIKKSWGWDSPNFGDYSKGTHHTVRTRDVYQRQLLYGQSIPLLIDAAAPQADQSSIGCRVNQVFDRRDFRDADLLFALSLLRENFGRVGVVAATISVEQWLEDQQVEWELLPVGVGEGVPFNRVLGKFSRQPTQQRLGTIRARYDAVNALAPSAIVVGVGRRAG